MPKRPAMNYVINGKQVPPEIFHKRMRDTLIYALPAMSIAFFATGYIISLLNISSSFSVGSQAFTAPPLFYFTIFSLGYSFVHAGALFTYFGETRKIMLLGICVAGLLGLTLDGAITSVLGAAALAGTIPPPLFSVGLFLFIWLLFIDILVYLKK